MCHAPQARRPQVSPAPAQDGQKILAGWTPSPRDLHMPGLTRRGSLKSAPEGGKAAGLSPCACRHHTPVRAPLSLEGSPSMLRRRKSSTRCLPFSSAVLAQPCPQPPRRAAMPAATLWLRSSWEASTRVQPSLGPQVTYHVPSNIAALRAGKLASHPGSSRAALLLSGGRHSLCLLLLLGCYGPNTKRAHTRPPQRPHADGWRAAPPCGCSSLKQQAGGGEEQ